MLLAHLVGLTCTVISLLHSGGFSQLVVREKCPAPELVIQTVCHQPLAVNENCIRPSWSLSAKLQMRSSSLPFSRTLRFTSASTWRRSRQWMTGLRSCFGSLRNLSSSHQDSSDDTSHEAPRLQHGSRPPGCHGRCVQRQVRCPAVKTPAWWTHRAEAQHMGIALSRSFDNNNQIAYVDREAIL